MSLNVDQVQVGDYLICTTGPKRQVRDQFGQIIEVTEKGIEGTLFKVEAISGPMMFMTVYPVPCGNIGTHSHDHHSWTGVFNFNRAVWQHASAGFVKTYLAAMNETPKKAKRVKHKDPLGELLLHGLDDDMYEDEENEEENFGDSNPH